MLLLHLGLWECIDPEGGEVHESRSAVYRSDMWSVDQEGSQSIEPEACTVYESWQSWVVRTRIPGHKISHYEKLLKYLWNSLMIPLMFINFLWQQTRPSVKRLQFFLLLLLLQLLLLPVIWSKSLWTRTEGFSFCSFSSFFFKISLFCAMMCNHVYILYYILCLRLLVCTLACNVNANGCVTLAYKK